MTTNLETSTNDPPSASWIVCVRPRKCSGLPGAASLQRLLEFFVGKREAFLVVGGWNFNPPICKKNGIIFSRLGSKIQKWNLINHHLDIQPWETKKIWLTSPKFGSLGRWVSFWTGWVSSCLAGGKLKASSCKKGSIRRCCLVFGSKSMDIFGFGSSKSTDCPTKRYNHTIFHTSYCRNSPCFCWPLQTFISQKKTNALFASIGHHEPRSTDGETDLGAIFWSKNCDASWQGNKNCHVGKGGSWGTTWMSRTGS